MAFDLHRWSRQSVALNTGEVTAAATDYNGPALFTYESESDNAAAVEAANYFAGAVYDLAVGDLIFANASDSFTARRVLALDRSAGTITTEGVGLNDSIATANIQDNAVTLAKMAHGTDGNLITYDAAGAPAYVATGTVGQVLTSGGAGAVPTFQTLAVDLTSEVSGLLPVANGGTGVGTLTDGGILLGSGTGAITPMAVLGDAEFVIGDGATDPGAAVLSGDVTCTNAGVVTIANDAVSSAKLAEDTIQTATVTISTAELLALATTPKTLVAAPGADKVIEFLGATLVLNYNSIAYTESSDNMVVKFEDASGVAVSDVIEMTGFIDQTADTLTFAVPVKDPIVAATGCVNKALVMDNNNANFAAGNSPVDVHVAYKVITAGL